MSLEDNCLFGEVLFVNDLISYEGATPDELQKAFVAAVDHYLETCKQNGLVPDKGFNGSFNVRLSPDLHKQACLKATVRGLSLNEFVKECVASGVAEDKKIVTENHLHTHIHQVEITVDQKYYEETPLWQRGVSNSPRKDN